MSDMSYEFQSEARVWISLDVDTSNGRTSTLKLTISEVARLYRLLGAALREYSAQTSDVLQALGDEVDENE